MVRNQPTAQLLCCEAGVHMLLMQDYCLECTLQYAELHAKGIVIVS